MEAIHLVNSGLQIPQVTTFSFFDSIISVLSVLRSSISLISHERRMWYNICTTSNDLMKVG